jgi:outer membrane lipoprotein SlyB
MKIRTLIIASIIAVATLTTACANNGYNPESSASSTPYNSSVTYGVIEAIETVPGDSGGIAGSGIGAGTVIGGVVGGVLGHQVGGGTGKDIATVAGVVGGAVVGHEIDKRNQQQQDVYRIQVRTDNGGYQTLTQESINDLRVGDRVSIENGNIYRY